MTLTIHTEIEQGSPEWLEARRGIITASVIGKLITPSTLKVADNETSRGVIYTLAAERITGHVEYVHPTFDMQRGHDDEPFARAVYADNFGPVEEVGFMVRDFGAFRIGFSPDGLVGKDGCIEIKSRKAKEQLATVLLNRVPLYNLAQIHTGMLVADREWCDYVSFSAGLPLWTKRIDRDPKWDAVVKSAASEFEINVTNIVDNFNASTGGLPKTERRPEFEEIRF